MLLTSGQVSVAVTSTIGMQPAVPLPTNVTRCRVSYHIALQLFPIYANTNTPLPSLVFLCTAALFLSGYVLQQRTLRDLRAAIKPSPRPSPKIFLPDRFKQSTTELPDGTVIALDGEAGRAGDVAIEVKPTLPDEAGAKHPNPDGDVGVGTAKPQTKEQPTKTVKGQGKNSSSSNKKGKGSPADEGSDSPQKPLSRAERRRLIKEEIMKLSQGEQRGYYQRRLW